jgi:hypothetical protein
MCSSSDAHDFKNVLHLVSDVFIMDINLASVFRFSSRISSDGSCQERIQHLFAQDDEARHGSQTFWRGFISLRVFDAADQVFSTKLLQIIRSLPSMIIGDGIAKDLFDSSRKIRRTKPSWMGRKSDDPFHHGSHSRPIDIDASDSGLSHLGAKRPRIQSLIVNERYVHPSQNSQKSFHDDFQRCRDLGKPLNPPAIPQLFDVVCNHFDPQDALAFAIHLDRQLPIMDFEDRQIIDRSLDHGLQSGLALDVPSEKATRLGAKDGFDPLQLERGPRSINGALKNLIQDAPSRKEKITAILGLVNGIGVTKPTFLLLPTLQSETQARVDPTLTGSNQTPYRARSSHGICDPGQACGVGDLGKTIVFFGKRNLALPGLASHILMSIEDNLSGKGRMGTEFDRQVPPLRVQNMEGIMIDVSDFSLNVGDAFVRAVHMENRRRGNGTEDIEDPPESRVLGKMLFGHFMLLFPCSAVDQGDPLFLSIGMNPAAKATREPHQMGVVKILIASPQPTPPGSESSGGLGQNEVGVQNNAVDTIIGSGQIRLIGLREFIRHLHRSSSSGDTNPTIGEVIDEVNALQNIGASGGVIHGGVKGAEILAQRPPGVAGRPEGQNLGALVALCG